eukprot:3302284-Pleurochrysis_carterae.AAC.1
MGAYVPEWYMRGICVSVRPKLTQNDGWIVHRPEEGVVLHGVKCCQFESAGCQEVNIARTCAKLSLVTSQRHGGMQGNTKAPARHLHQCSPKLSKKREFAVSWVVPTHPKM